MDEEKKRWWIIIPIAVVATFIVGMAIPNLALATPEKKIVVGSKYFTENELFAHLSALYLQDKGYEVEKKLDLPGSLMLIEGMKKGDIDLYYDYTGTLTESVLGLNLTGKDITDPDEFYSTAKEGMEEKYHFTLARNLTYEHKYTMAMKKDCAEELGIEKISDLSEYDQDMTLATDEETITRPDGLPRVKMLYDLDFAEVKSMDIMMCYPAIKRGDVDVIIGLSMDARQYEYDLVNLEDDKGWQPRYHPVPVIRKETLAEYPELSNALDELVPHLTRDNMLDMVYDVDIRDMDAEKVAQDFLVGEGLIAVPSPTPAPPGFEAIFAIPGLLSIAYLLSRRKRK